MQATIDRERRRELRQKILDNIFAIVIRIDDLEKKSAEIKNHLHIHDRFFFQQQTNLQEDETYGSQDDLAELYLDTVRMISQLEKARFQLDTACTLMHFYDYSSNAIFEEFASQQAESL
jgi:hypothetical protein